MLLGSILGGLGRHTLAHLLGLVLSFTLVSESSAYSPNAHFLLKQWVLKQNKTSTFRLTYLVTAYNDSQATGVKFKEKTVFYLKNQTFVSTAYDEAGKKIYSVKREFSDWAPWIQILLPGDSKHLQNVLRAHAVPLLTEEELNEFKTESERVNAEPEFLGRFQGKVAWVIGNISSHISGAAANTLGSSLWLEKDSFLPIRFLLSGKNADSADYDFWAPNFRTYRDMNFPQTVELSQKGKGRLLLAELLDVDGSAETKGELNKKQRSAQASALTDSLRSELSDLVKTYYSTLR